MPQQAIQRYRLPARLEMSRPTREDTWYNSRMRPLVLFCLFPNIADLPTNIWKYEMIDEHYISFNIYK